MKKAVKWDDAVRQGKLLAQAEHDLKMHLGEQVDQMSDEDLSKYAEAIGTDLSFLKECRALYRAAAEVDPVFDDDDELLDEELEEEDE